MIAPDYSGFGHSDSPSPKEFAYLEAGHFALDTAVDDIADLVRGFVKRRD